MNLTVPAIDVSSLPEKHTITAIADACETWGFFQAVGHGIQTDQIEDFLAATRQFFQLPAATKQAVRRDHDNPMGFFDKELTKNTLDWKQIFDFGVDLGDPLASQPSQWPALPGFREAMTGWYRRCEQIGFILLDAIEQAMQLQPGQLSTHFTRRHTSFLRLNYYPLCDDPLQDRGSTVDQQAAGQLGVNRHTDAGVLTILVQDDVASLQVKKSSQWHTIHPEPGGLIINVGDMLQIWSNDRFQAPEHRVMASATQERFSAPFFFNPDYSTWCEPLSGNPRYRPVNWGEFRRLRASGDYTDLGEEIQIDQYRL